MQALKISYKWILWIKSSVEAIVQDTFKLAQMLVSAPNNICFLRIGVLVLYVFKDFFF